MIFLTLSNQCYRLHSSASKRYHTKHFKTYPRHMCLTYAQLNDEQKKFLMDNVSVSVDMPSIRKIMNQKYGIIINNDTISSARYRFTMVSLQQLGVDPSNSACDRLLAFFRIHRDISFISVTHTINSGFVTTRKLSSDNDDKAVSGKLGEENGIDAEEISQWRKDLQIGDGKKILVALAWMHKEHQRKVYMYPEVLCADVTFGVCKEQRNLFRICGVDGDFKVFEAMNCFMPSKQYRAFDWAINMAFPKLVGSNALRFNGMVSSDQELNLALALRKLVTNDKPWKPLNSSHRLDMYHIFIKEWRNNVSAMT